MAKSIQSKVVSSLKQGRKLTAAQITKMGLANPYDAIYKIRQRGEQVDGNKIKVRGVKVTAYRMANINK